MYIFFKVAVDCSLKYRQDSGLVSDINSGFTGMIEETAVPFPYARLIVGKRHCRVLR